MKKLLCCILCFVPLWLWAQPAPRTVGPTGLCSELQQIAAQEIPSTAISLQQVMVAFLQANPQSFYQENIHGLLPGAVLSVPSMEDMQKVTPQAAVAILEQQDADWKGLEAEYKKDHADIYLRMREQHCGVVAPAAAKEHIQNIMHKVRHREPSQVEQMTKTIAVLKTQVMALAQSNKTIREQVDQLLQQHQSEQELDATLQEKIHQIENQLHVGEQARKEIDSAMLVLNHAMSDMVKNETVMRLDDAGMTMSGVLAKHHYSLIIVLVILVLLIILTRCPLCARKRKKTSEDSPAAEYLETSDTVDETQGDTDESEEAYRPHLNYGYLSGEDVVRGKLDLARAYIDMEDVHQARKILESVLQEGTDDQRDEAKELLQQCDAAVQ